jgi:hypothetical protein
MTAIAAGDLTLSIAYRDRWWDGRKYHVMGTLTFGDGALTYSTGGIPLPAKEKFGFKRSMDSFEVFGVNGLTTDYAVRFDKTNHKLQLFEEEAAAAGGPLLEADTSEAPAARVYRFHAIGE